MKKLLLFSLSILLLYGCSTSSDGNGNSTTTVVPLPPSNLTGTVVSTTQINLFWADHSTNETGFKIERKTGTGTFAVVSTTATDVTTFNDIGLSLGTTYTYRVYSNNAVGNSLTYSNELTLTTSSVISLPTLTTTAASSIATTTAVSGGTISSDGGATITARGVCWSTSTNPTIALSTKTTDGTGTGVFTSNLTALSANTTYYVRAYATNSVGTAYGTEISFITSNTPSASVTDIDGNTYQSVIICSQVWTKSNLNVSKYSDGTPIPQVTDPTAWANLTTGAWCYYNNDAANGTTYGKLYNWYATAGIYDAASLANPTLRKKLAPTGWHVPSDAEWTTLTTCLGGESLAGGKMKETGTAHWDSPNTGATNSSGFTGLPGGYRYDDAFGNIGYSGLWWSSSEYYTAYAWYRDLDYSDGDADRYVNDKIYGFSVRCLRD